MAENQLTFNRIEKKFLVPAEIFPEFFAELREHLVPDQNPKYTINNLYFDTPDYAMIRKSIESPVYKEKLRLRWYGNGSPDDAAFLEIKKKYKGIVYKRRENLTNEDISKILASPLSYEMPKDTQIWREITYLRDYWKPIPMTYIAYDREAFAGKEDKELRITFDRNLRYRKDNLNTSDYSSSPIMDGSNILMEIKFPGTSPLWLARLLSKYEIRQSSFSKYGTCYKNFLIADFKDKYLGGNKNV